jgi:hypothetical protein
MSTTKPTVIPSIESKIKKIEIDNKTKNILLEEKKKGNTLQFLKTLVLKHKNLYKLILILIIFIVIYYKFF